MASPQNGVGARRLDTTRRRKVHPLPIVLIVGWLCAAGGGTPPVVASAGQALGNVPRCVPSAGGGAARQRPARALAARTTQAASTPPPVAGATRFLRSWARLSERTQAQEPDWLSPLATTSGRLKQEFRYDVWRQTKPSGEVDYTFSGAKGLELIVAPRLQVLLGVPSYVEHTHGGPNDGFGDLPLMLKIRLASAPAGEGEYLVTLIVSTTVPTGSQAVGLHAAVLSPAIAVGKAWRRFDVQSTLGPNLPSGNTSRLGRQFAWNTTFQYRARWMLWPELEVNSTSYLTGPNAGDTQAFLTPGLGFGRVRLWRNLRYSAAAGCQIAATRFHTYDHQWMFSNRLNF